MDFTLRLVVSGDTKVCFVNFSELFSEVSGLFIQPADVEVMCRHFSTFRCVLCFNLFNGLMQMLVLGSKVGKLFGEIGDGCGDGFV